MSARANEAEDKTIEYVKKLGGTVTRDGPLIHVDLYSSKVTDADLKEVASLKDITSLRLSLGVTGAGLKELAALKKLISLALSGNEVTDAAIEELAPLKNLVFLSLANTKVTEDGIAELRKSLLGCRILR